MTADRRKREEILDSVIREFGFEHPFTIDTAKMIESKVLTTGKIITLVRLRRTFERDKFFEDEED